MKISAKELFLIFEIYFRRDTFIPETNSKIGDFVLIFRMPRIMGKIRGFAHFRASKNCQK